MGVHANAQARTGWSPRAGQVDSSWGSTERAGGGLPSRSRRRLRTAGRCASGRPTPEQRASGLWALDRFQPSAPFAASDRPPRSSSGSVQARERTGWGPRLIAGETGVAHSTVHAILRRHGCSRAAGRPRARSVRYEWPCPGRSAAHGRQALSALPLAPGTRSPAIAPAAMSQKARTARLRLLPRRSSTTTAASPTASCIADQRGATVGRLHGTRRSPGFAHYDIEPGRLHERQRLDLHEATVL